MTGGDNVTAVVGPGDSVACSYVCFTSVSRARFLSCFILPEYTYRVFKIKYSEIASTTADIPESYRTVRASACEDVVIAWTPSNG